MTTPGSPRLFILSLASLALLATSAACTFDSAPWGRCETESARKNGYVCQSGRWVPVEPDASGSRSDARHSRAAPDATSDTSPSPSDDTCTGARCTGPTCRDDVRNGEETDVDCGGPDCPKCPIGKSCRRDGDCLSSNCEESECRPEPSPTCNEGETRNVGRSEGRKCGYKDRGRTYQVCKNDTWETRCGNVWYRSCLEIREDPDRSLKAGEYTLYPRGIARSNAPKYRCSTDGWTLVAGDDFDNGNAPGWSKTETGRCGNARLLGGPGIRGGEGRDQVSKRYGLGPVPHAEVRAETRFFAIDDWEAQGRQGDTVVLELQDQIVANASNFSGQQGKQICGNDRGRLGPNRESVDTLSGEIPRRASNATVSVVTEMTAEADNESWGLDWVRVWVR